VRGETSANNSGIVWNESYRGPFIDHQLPLACPLESLVGETIGQGSPAHLSPITVNKP